LLFGVDGVVRRASCAARRLFNHSSAGTTSGSCSLKRRTSCAANAADNTPVLSERPSCRLRDAFDSKQAIGARIGFLAGCLAIDDVVGQTTQVFDQHHRNVIEIARARQWSAAAHVIGAQEADQAFRLQPTVCVGDQSPGESEYARISSNVPSTSLEFDGKIRRKIGADCKYLFGENMEIVDEPLGGGCCGSCVSGRFDGRQIGEAQRFVVVSKARFEATVDDRLKAMRWVPPDMRRVAQASRYRTVLHVWEGSQLGCANAGSAEEGYRLKKTPSARILTGSGL